MEQCSCVNAMYLLQCCATALCTQEKYVLAASNDYAARLWSVSEQKARVSTTAVYCNTYPVLCRSSEICEIHKQCVTNSFSIM